jgi:phage major head subunit gpT-like protein
MPQIYVANCSKHDFLFAYMFVENPKPFHHKIRAGSQVRIEASTDEIDQIIKQHSIYGMQPIEAVKKGFGGLAYRLNKPISVEAIEQGLSQSDQEAIDRALEARKNTAAAVDSILSNKAQEFGSRQSAPVEIEVIEEGKGPADNSVKFNETITVVKDGIEPPKAKRGRPRKA